MLGKKKKKDTFKNSAVYQSDIYTSLKENFCITVLTQKLCQAVQNTECKTKCWFK